MDGKALRDKLVGSDDERAVSPVIGVILMVAITVILAAVIATLVMDFGDSVDQETNAGVTLESDNSGNVTAAWQSEGNADTVYLISDGCDDIDGETLGNVGDTATGDCDSDDVISAVAEGSNGNTTVQTHTVD